MKLHSLPCISKEKSAQLFSLSPNKSLDGGAHHAGEQEEWGDQDVKQGQGGKRNSWRQIGVLRDVNMNHKRLQKEREDRAAQGQLKRLFFSLVALSR